MRDKAVAMLTALGVAGAADDPLLDMVLTNVQWRIKNLSNLSEIPEGLESLAVSMAVGEYLNMKLMFQKTACTADPEEAAFLQNPSGG